MSKSTIPLSFFFSLHSFPSSHFHIRPDHGISHSTNCICFLVIWILYFKLYKSFLCLRDIDQLLNLPLEQWSIDEQANKVIIYISISISINKWERIKPRGRKRFLAIERKKRERKGFRNSVTPRLPTVEIKWRFWATSKIDTRRLGDTYGGPTPVASRIGGKVAERAIYRASKRRCIK